MVLNDELLQKVVCSKYLVLHVLDGGTYIEVWSRGG